MTDELIKALVELDEEAVVKKVAELRNKGTSALDILAVLQQGMDEIGRKFEANEYFLSELIMSGDIFKRATEELGDAFKPEDTHKLGTVLIGTIKDDVHNIGKDIVITVLSCNGFKVVDLGVDVPTEKFLEAIKEHDPQIIGISCLLTSCFDNMQKTIAAIDKDGLREGRKILIGGGPVDAQTAAYVKADGFSTNAQEAVDMCKRIAGM